MQQKILPGADFLGNQNHHFKWWFAQPLEGAITGIAHKGVSKVWHRITLTGRR